MALIAQSVEHCTGHTMVVGSNPVQGVNFLGHFSSSVSFFHMRIGLAILQLTVVKLKLGAVESL